jgi:CubicO group peptidase (beta-lactamase class C family)
MTHKLILVGLFVLTLSCRPEPTPSSQAETYYPGPGEAWESKRPEQVGMSPEGLDKALATAKKYAADIPLDPAEMLRKRFAGESHNEIIGPTKQRAEINGIVLRNGYIVAEFGDTKRVDMAFSITKSFLATAAGLALDQGLIQSTHDQVKDYVDDGGFDSPHNAKITWHHFLQQTSEWEGTLFDKPHWAEEEPGHQRQEPGAVLGHNDVRVNRLSLSLLRLWKRPLPDVLEEYIMDRIDATDTWEWHGYRNSEVEVDGRKMVSVSGGGHWGGGIWMSTRDLARFGYLHLRRGKWKDQQLLSERWLDMAMTPCEVYPDFGYGYMWWVNTDGKIWPHAPHSSFAARGAGSGIIWVDPEHDLVLVLRWFDWDKGDEILRDLIAAVKSP